jgi:hypothetical protein
LGNPFFDVVVEQPQPNGASGTFTGSLACNGQWQTVELPYPVDMVPGKAFATGEAFTGAAFTASDTRQISLSS